jgi:hypothetical protein
MTSEASPQTMTRRARSEAGQGIVEMAIVLPVTVLIALGVVELSYALLHEHILSKVSREGANLISRDVSLLDAGTALQKMETPPVDFTNGSRVIFSVLKKGATVGTPNYDRIILYQRHAVGPIAAASSLTTQGGGAFGPAPDFQAINSDNDTNLRITNLPANLDIVRGGLLYVAEVFTDHEVLTPLHRFGVTVPPRLHSVAFF